MTLNRKQLTVLASCTLGLLCSVQAVAESWKGQTFLSDYSKLQPLPGKEGKDYLYYVPNLEERTAKYT